MKIKVGEYVRTKNGQIYKIEDGTEFYEDSVNVGIGIIPDVNGIWVDKEHFTYVDKRDIVKNSPNILDLIEVGDIVKTGIDTIFMNVFETQENLDYFKELHKNDADVIRTIVTHEQFEDMEYKV